MRASRRWAVILAGLAAACGGDGNGPGNADPSAAFTSSCTALACTFTNASTDPDGAADITTYAWDFGESGSSSNTAITANAAHTYAAAGTFTVQLTVTDAAGATNSVTHDVTVTGTGGGTAPTAEFTSSCTALDCTFTDGSTDDGTVTAWTWNFGDGSAISPEQNPAHSYSTDGTYTVQLTVTDNDGQTGTISHDVAVAGAAAGQPTAKFSFNCSSADCVFHDNSTPAVGHTIAAWSWDFGDGATDNVSDPAHSYTISAADSFSVVLIATDDAGAADTVTKVVTVAPPATCGGGNCDLTLNAPATVTATLTSVGCNANGNIFIITAPVVDTLFTDGCHTPLGTTHTITGAGGAKFAAGTQITAKVISGSQQLSFPPTVRVKTGTSYPNWTLEFDDGEGCGQSDPTCGGVEPDFNDLIITITANP